MLGTKRTLSFWLPKKRLLSLARALAPDRPGRERAAAMAHVVVDARTKARLALAAKRQGRFVED